MPWAAGWGGLRRLVDECGDLISEEAGTGAGAPGQQPPFQKLPQGRQLIFWGPPAVLVVMQLGGQETRAPRLAGGGNADVVR